MKVVRTVLVLQLLSFSLFLQQLTAFPNYVIKGGSTLASVSTVDLDALKELGSTHARIYAHWAYIEPSISHIDYSLTVQYLQQNPGLISKWSSTVDWSLVDSTVAAHLQRNISIIMELGEGTVQALPKLNTSNINFDPNVVGEEVYLAHMYRYCRAAVMRYKSKQVSLFQIENELNEAWLASIGGQRYFTTETLFTGGSWRDWDFLTRLLQTLRSAVKDEYPSAEVTQNFHTDVPSWVHDLLLLKGYYIDAISDWGSILDFISIDAYPNMFVDSPCLSNVIVERLQNIHSLNLAKPVMIMETSYLVDSNTSSTNHLSANFTEQNQAACARALILDSVNQGFSQGFFWFKVVQQTGILPPPGGYSQEDLSALNFISNLQNPDGDSWVIIEWLVNFEHVEYLTSGRLKQVLSSWKEGFGIITMDGRKRLAFEAIKNSFAQI